MTVHATSQEVLQAPHVHDIQKRAFEQILKFAEEDFYKPPRVVVEIRVGYNPAPHDLAGKPQEEQEYWERRKREEKMLIEKGVIGGHENFTGDAERCYKYALAFKIAGNEKYAKKCIEILHAWSEKCKRFGILKENGPLEAGWGLSGLMMAANLIRDNCNCWKNSGVETKFVTFVKQLLMPNLKYFDDHNGNLKSFPKDGNWGTTIVYARLQFALFINDHKEIELCIRNFRALFENLLKYDDGRVHETSRDIVHAQFGLAGLAGAAELLYNKGVDLYSFKGNRLMKAYELHARILLGDIPPKLKDQKLNWVKWIPANWEMVYNHYVGRKNMRMDAVKAILQKHRPESFEFHWGAGTVTHFCPK
jgi:hypothetical protein